MRKLLDKGHKTREKLVLSACRVFGTEGYHVTKIERVAEEAGVAKGTLYQYLRSKSELYEACLEIALAEFSRLSQDLAKLSAFSGVHNPCEFRSRVSQICKVFFDGFVKRSELMSLFQASSTSAEPFNERFRPIVLELRKDLDTLIQNAKNRSWLRNPTSSRDLSLFVMATFQGVFTLNYDRTQDTKLFRELPPSFKVDNFVDFLLRGLGFTET